METSHYCEKSICLPVTSEEEYERLVHRTKDFRAYLVTMIEAHEELFPAEIKTGFRFHGFIESKKLNITLRRILVMETGEAYQVRPDFVMPYMVGRAEEAAKGLALCHQGTPFETIVEVCGHNGPYWYRMYVSLGRVSLVGTTVKRVERLPKNLTVDEKHSWLLGEKIYLPTVAGGGVFLGVSVTNKADAADLEAGYGEFKTEVLELDAAYEPQTVNTDGWEATQVAWKRLFPTTTLILCFLHSILSVRDRGRSWPDCQILIHHLWKAYREKTEAEFRAALSRIPALAAQLTLPDSVLVKTRELSAKVAHFAVAYHFPGAHRTSNAVDRLINHQDRVLFAHQYFHGTPDSARLSARAMALISNFHPFGRRTRDQFPDKISPFVTLNGFQYHSHWLRNLLIASSRGGKPPKHKIR